MQINSLINFPEFANVSLADTKVRKAIHSVYKGIDFYTRHVLPYEHMTLDHVYPRSMGGPDNIFNLVPTSLSMNATKGAQYNAVAACAVLSIIRVHYARKVLAVLGLDQEAASFLTHRQTVNLTGKPVFWFVTGRGRTGKTLFVRHAVETAINRGASISLVTSDTVKHDINAYFTGACEMPSSSLDEMKGWFRQLCEFVIEDKCGTFVDLSEGSHSFLSFLRDTPGFVDILSGNGVAPVLIYMCGKSANDLTLLSEYQKLGFTPEATAIVCNEYDGSRSEFDAMTGHSVYQNAISSGAQHIWMPKLPVHATSWLDENPMPFQDALEKAPSFAASSLNGWLSKMDKETAPIQSWLPSTAP